MVNRSSFLVYLGFARDRVADVELNHCLGILALMPWPVLASRAGGLYL